MSGRGGSEFPFSRRTHSTARCAPLQSNIAQTQRGGPACGVHAAGLPAGSLL